MKSVICVDCSKSISPMAKRCVKCSIEAKVMPSGTQCWNWKGDKVGYSPLHFWIKKNKPKSDFCQECNEVPPYELANISGEYHRDINDFEWLCRRCHMIKDGRMSNLHKNIWSEKEINILKIHYPNKTALEVSSLINRTERGIMLKAWKMYLRNTEGLI